MLWQFNKAGDLLLVGFLGEKHVVVADDSDSAIGVVVCLALKLPLNFNCQVMQAGSFSFVDVHTAISCFVLLAFTSSAQCCLWVWPG